MKKVVIRAAAVAAAEFVLAAGYLAAVAQQPCEFGRCEKIRATS